jgi:hypothetical protein
MATATNSPEVFEPVVAVIVVEVVFTINALRTNTDIVLAEVFH